MINWRSCNITFFDFNWNIFFETNKSKYLSNKYIDDIYEGALKNGALGGKLLGAGGGGFFMFYSPPFEKHNLIKFLESKKLKVQPFRFEENGLQTWTSRINDRNKSEGSK